MARDAASTDVQGCGEGAAYTPEVNSEQLDALQLLQNGEMFNTI